jgi:4-hydroxy-2-oxovalerate aldolase
MPHKNDICVMDVTIRDGSYAVNYQWSLGQTAQIARALDKAGIRYIEVSHGCGLGASETMGLTAAASDVEYVRSARSAVKKAGVGVIAGAGHVTRKKDIDSVIDDIDFIRFAANADDPRAVEENLNYAKGLRPRLPIFFQLMRSSRLPKARLLKSAHIAQEMGADVVYVVDTAGHFIPQEVEDIVSTLVAKLKIKVGFHGHDNLRMAAANSLAAIKAGAVHVDASLKGIGRAGGNVQLEALVSLMKRSGCARGIDLDILAGAAEELVAPVMPPSAGISKVDLITADANIDLYPAEFYLDAAERGGIAFEKLVRKLAGDERTVEAGEGPLKRALKGLGVDPEAVLPQRAGITAPAPRIKDPCVLLALGSTLDSMQVRPELLDGLQRDFPSARFTFVLGSKKELNGIEDADILFTYEMTEDILAGAKRLKWLHSIVTEYDPEFLQKVEKAGIKVTFASGLYAEPVAETALGAILALRRKIKDAVEAQAAGRWGFREIMNSVPHIGELFGSNMVIVGHSDAAERLARLCAGLGMDVTVVNEKGRGDSNFIDRFVRPKALNDALLDADCLVAAGRLEGGRHPLIGRAELGRLKEDAIVVNVAAAGTVDEGALLDALSSRMIGGAVLDVFEGGELKAGHPLYSAPNTIILPRIAMMSDRLWGRALSQFAEMLREMV